MLPFPIFQTVRRGRQLILAFLLGLLVPAAVAAFITVGVFQAPPWLLLVIFFGGILLAAIVGLRLFIRWRLRAYGSAENIRQLHLLASLSGMALPNQIEPLAKALSSRAEDERWQELMTREKQSVLNPFPYPPPEEVRIGYSPQKLLLVLGIVVLGAVLVRWLTPMAVNFIYEALLAGLILFFVFRLTRIFREKQPALVLSKSGLMFPAENRFYPWDGVSDAEVIKVPTGKSAIYKLRFRHNGKLERRTIANWNITPGELRYLLLLYQDVQGR